MDQQQSNVKRFLKLGYLYEDIMRVLENLRQDAPTNDILEELIRTCRSTSPAQSSSQLVPRGCSRTTPGTAMDPTTEFRPIVIDGSNVAMSHGNKQVFSCRGVQLAVSWFWNRGHRDITVFVPLWRKEQARSEAPITDQHILHELEHRKILVFTPSRCVNGKRVVCYDDRYIVKLAFDSDGIIVSNDNYRDLQGEKPEWKRFIEERLLMYTFANDKFMPPDDPLGRNGPTIDNFLRKGARVPETRGQHCPYGKKCTYGMKCRFYHPERSSQAQLSVADMLRAKKRELPHHQASPKEGPASLQYSSFPPATAPTLQQRSGRFSPSKSSDSPTLLRRAFTSSSLESQHGATSTQYIEAFPYGAPETDFHQHPCHGRCDQAGNSPHMPGHQQRHRQGSRSSHSREPVHYTEQPFHRQPSVPAADLRAWGYSPPGSPSFYGHNLDPSDLAPLINEFRII